MTKDTKKPIEFLKKMYPEGPWCLTAISIIKKERLPTQTFRPGDEAKMQKFIAKHAEVDNLYFHVNPVKGNLTKKAKRENIASVNYLHVDVDPEPGLNLEQEQARILELFTTKLPKGIPPPTIVTYSGGGYQAFWKLETPLKINGDLGLAEDAKLFNLQIERVFNADNCHNIDRLMRLAGTMNLPDAKKIEKGRAPAMSALMAFNPSNVYPIASFKRAVEVQMEGIGKTKADIDVKLSGNVERFASLDFLKTKYDVDNITLVAIARGKDEDNPKVGDDSRSAWVFHVVCQLARCEVPDDTIFSLLTDPDWGISDSILEMGNNAEKYAIRQISRGKQNAIDPMLLMLNERYAVIQSFGGKCRVIEDSYNRSTGNNDLLKMAPYDFFNAWCHKEVWVPNPKSKNGTGVMPVKLGKWWFEHPKRRMYNRIVFEPDYEGVEDYNLWRGFKYSALPGNCELFLDHIRDNVCDGNDGHFQYLIKWMARTVQLPGEQGKVAVVIKGGKGTGKSFFATQFGKLFGRHFKHVSNGQHLVGNFNSHLRDCLVLFADEAFFAGDKKHESVLKTIITERTIPIEPKGVDMENVANYIHLIMASNNEHVIPAGAGERRYFVLDIGTKVQRNAAYFGAIVEQLQSGGYEALLNYLLEVDLEGYDVTDVPQTDALRNQKMHSLSQEEEWWHRKLHAGKIFDFHRGWQQSVPAHELINDYVAGIQLMNSTRRGSATKFGLFLKDIIPNLDRWRMPSIGTDQDRTDGFTFHEDTDKTVRHWAYCFPTLNACRARWEERFGETDWDDPASDEGDQIDFNENQEVPF